MAFSSFRLNTLIVGNFLMTETNLISKESFPPTHQRVFFVFTVWIAQSIVTLENNFSTSQTSKN